MKNKVARWLILVAIIGIMKFVVIPIFIDPYIPIHTGNGSSKIGDTVIIDNLEYTISGAKSDAYSGGTLSYILQTGHGENFDTKALEQLRSSQTYECYKPHFKWTGPNHYRLHRSYSSLALSLL